MSFLTQQKNGLLYHTSTVLEGGGGGPRLLQPLRRRQ